MSNIMILSPYSHDDENIVEARVAEAEAYMAKLLKEGHQAISMPACFHKTIVKFDIPGYFDFWKKFCFQMIEMVDEIHILMIDGWEISPGVEEEIEYARSLGKKITYVPSIFGIP